MSDTEDELAGYVAGLIVSPVMILTSEWMAAVWGGGVFANMGEAECYSTREFEADRHANSLQLVDS